MRNYDLPDFLVESLSNGDLNRAIKKVIKENKIEELSKFKEFSLNDYLPFIKAYIGNLIVDEALKEATDESECMSFDELMSFYDDEDIYASEECDMDSMYEEDEFENDDYSFENGDPYNYEADEDFGMQMMYGEDDLGEENKYLDSELIVLGVYDEYLNSPAKIYEAITDLHDHIITADESYEYIQAQYIIGRIRINNLFQLKFTDEYQKLKKYNDFILNELNKYSIYEIAEDFKGLVLELIKCLIVNRILVEKNTDDIYDSNIGFTSDFMADVISEAFINFSELQTSFESRIDDRQRSRRLIREIKGIVKQNGFDK